MTCAACSGYNTQKEEDPSDCKDCGCGCGGLKKSDAMKASISFKQALLFFFIASPVLYGLTGKIGGWGECPTVAGVAVHAVVFGLIVYILMSVWAKSPYPTAAQKFRTKIAIQQAILFALIANPVTFKIVRKALGDWVSSDSGCASPLGLLLHSAVFGLADFGLMKLSS